MSHRRTTGLAIALTGLAVGASAGTASASTTQTFNCQASIAQVTALGSQLAVAPYVANAGAQACANANSALNSNLPLNLGPLGSLGTALGQITVGPATASTLSTATASQLAADATTTVSGISIPTPAGAITVAGPVTAVAGYVCSNGVAVPNDSSTLSSLSIGGTPVTLSSAGASQTIPLTVLGQQIGSVTVNPQTITPTSNQQALLDVQLPVAGADVTIGASAVTQPLTNACAQLPSGQPSTPGSPVTPIDVSGPGTSTQDGGSSSTSTTTSSTSSSSSDTLSAIQADVTGAKVMTLAAARRRYHSPCLRGSGSPYVAVGTPRADRITVRRIPLRVLGLGGRDRISVQGGCVDGGSGADRIVSRGANRIAVWGGAGADVIRVGNAPAALHGGAGNDTIVAGSGADRISGGSGTNRITARGAGARVSAGRGTSTAWLVGPARGYARHHGVRRVRTIA